MRIHPFGMTLLSPSALVILPLFLPAIFADSTNTNLTTPVSNDFADCTPASIGSIQSCAAAILLLPESIEPVSFHRGGHDDVGYLPVRETHGDCTIYVDMPEGGTATSTWTSITVAANLLLTACTDFSSRRPRTGGFTTKEDGKIKITLRAAVRADGAVNATGLATA